MSGQSVGLPESSSKQNSAPIINTPIVDLVRPPKPEDCLKQITAMWLAAHHVDPLFVGRDLDEKAMEKMIHKEILPVPAWQTVLECVKLTFVVYNISRPAQQQLTRQRLGTGFNNNSLRIIKLEEFAHDKRYRIPSGIVASEEILMKYESIIEGIQAAYQVLLKMGVNTEDARGILPQNIHSPTVTMTSDLRALLGFIPKRLCCEAQDEMNEFAVALQNEINNWSPVFGGMFGYPCARNMECVIGPEAAERCPTGYPWKGGVNKGVVVTSYKEEEKDA